MKTEMMMPQMGESIAEATILKWLKAVGDTVEKDETILEISTDKVDSEIPAPASGVLVELKAKEGETVAVKSVIAIIETDKAAAVSPASTVSTAGAASAAPTPSTTSSAPMAKTAAPVAKVTVESNRGAEMTSPFPASPRPTIQTANGAELVKHVGGEASVPAHSGNRFYSPLVRSMASQHGIATGELDQLPGSGAQGRVTKADVLAYLETRGTTPAASTPTAAASAKPAAPPAARPEYNAEGIRVEPFDKMRKIIAEHMVRSKATSPHVYSMAEVDITNIVKWREKNQSQFVAREGFKLSFTPFFLEAVVKGLIQFPGVNASVEGDNLILKKFVNLGCAVALGTTGLIVPVIKNADKLSFTGIATSLNDLANRARTKKLVPEEIQGGTFTVTNPGVFGNIMGCPIINQPQLAIMGVGAIKKRVMVVNDMIAIRDMVYLTLSYDHRVIDGSLGGQFMAYVTKYLEGWDMDRPLY